MQSKRPSFFVLMRRGFANHLQEWAHPEYSEGMRKIFSAAVVNREFCDMLLENPATAIDKGYHGETFTITPDERSLITSIRARTLGDLGKQVVRSLREKGS